MMQCFEESTLFMLGTFQVIVWNGWVTINVSLHCVVSNTSSCEHYALPSTVQSSFVGIFDSSFHPWWLSFELGSNLSPFPNTEFGSQVSLEQVFFRFNLNDKGFCTHWKESLITKNVPWKIVRDLLYLKGRLNRGVFFFSSSLYCTPVVLSV